MEKDTTHKPYLNWQDICDLFDCGKSKALLLMQEIGIIYIGRKAFVKTNDLEKYLDTHRSIDITWPKRHQTKKRYE